MSEFLQTRVGELRAVQVEFLQVLQRREIGQPGAGHLFARDRERREVGQGRGIFGILFQCPLIQVARLIKRGFALIDRGETRESDRVVRLVDGRIADEDI